jgi:phenylpropionate dioxygenase-like ring-hydroxylating dioxygenase large terminal subunit
MSITHPGSDPATIPAAQPAQASSNESMREIGQKFAGLPMPYDRQMLFDVERRPRVLDEKKKRFPFPVPNGWFVVAEAKDLAPGEVMPFYAFAKDLVLYRTESGEPRVIDAHCPHLGAHIGVGGRVKDDCIQCPFHGWTFDGASGECVDVPYDDNDFIPKRANTRAYPTIERNKMIWAWHHLEGGEPFYDVPDVPEFSDPDWLPIVVRTYEIRTCAQELAENNVDYSHFKFVHGTESVPEHSFLVDGVYKRAANEDETFIREGYGLGLGVLRVQGFTTFLSSTTPIDEEKVLIRWIFTAPRSNGESAAEKAANTFCKNVSQDIPIWENKVYRETPVLRPSEKPITEHRRWAQQFYS